MANAELATAWIKLQPSFRGLKEDIAKEIDGVPTDKVGQQMGNRLTGGVGKGLAKLGGTVAAAFAVKKVADFFADSMDAVKNWQVLNAQTAAVVQSTGGAANVTADQVHKLAGSLEGLTATQAESIQEGANMLLTFKNIQNRVGEGNDIFNQATEALVDMSRAMGTDPQQAAIQLGKALNDPIQGVSALQRVGIQFTEDQKKVIKALVDTGDVAGAQKIILEELNDQFGGSGAAYADTYAGKLFLLQDAFGDIGEEVVTKLMPHLETMIDWLTTDGMTAVEDFMLVVEGLTTEIGKLSEQEWFTKLNEELASGGSLDLATGGFFETFKQRWAELPQSLRNSRVQVNTAVAEWWSGVTSQFDNGGRQIQTWWSQGWTDMGAKLANGRAQINAGVSALWGGITGAFANGWTQISTWWNSLWSGVWNTVTTISFRITAAIAGFIGGMIAKFANGWTQITGFFSTAAGTIKGIVDGVLKTFERVANGIRDAFRGIGKFIKDAFGPVTDFLGGVGRAVSGFFGGMGDRARHFKGKVQAAAQGGVGGKGGAALARVRATMPAGLRITDTLSNRARDQMLGLNRSVNSYHYDAKNPAVDIAGPTWLLHQYAARLRAMGGWRQMLWQVPGHYDHIHVAHSGGVVSPSWYRSPGDRWDERTVRLQVGETVLPKGWQAPSSAAEPMSLRPDGAGLVIQGDVYTTDVDEFFEYAERKKRVAVALAGLEG